jgi:hypothetical protein
MSVIIENRRVITITAKFTYEKVVTSKYLRIKDGEHDLKGATLPLQGWDHYRGADDARDATDLSSRTESEIMHLFHAIKSKVESNKIGSVDIVDLEIRITSIKVGFDPDEEREYLQRTALEKLTKDEILALGVMNLAIYDKVKNHGV